MRREAESSSTEVNSTFVMDFPQQTGPPIFNGPSLFSAYVILGFFIKDKNNFSDYIEKKFRITSLMHQTSVYTTERNWQGVGEGRE